MKGDLRVAIWSSPRRREVFSGDALAMLQEHGVGTIDGRKELSGTADAYLKLGIPITVALDVSNKQQRVEF